MTYKKLSIDKDEWKKIPYIRNFTSGHRHIPLLPYFDGREKRWMVFTPAGGQLIELKVADFVNGMYVSDSLVSSETDYGLPFAESTLKYFSTGKMTEFMNQATQDLINGLCFIEKYFILLKFRSTNTDSRMSDLIPVELEGAISNHRSYYDVIQKTIREIHVLYSESKQKLPQSFHDAIKKNDDDLHEKYLLPGPLISFYAQKRDLFLSLKEVRDNIVHRGGYYFTVFEFADGFSVRGDDEPFSAFGKLVPLWPGEKTRNNGLVSVLPLLCLLVEDMYKTMKSLGEAIEKSFGKLPEPLFDAHVYLRSKFTRHLRSLDHYEKEQWIDPAAVLGD